MLAAEAATLTAARGAVAVGPRTAACTTHIVRRSATASRCCPPPTPRVRCRCLLGLAVELYYVSSVEERRALVDEGVAMARRLGDPTLLIDALSGAFNALWTPGHEDERLAVRRRVARPGPRGAATSTPRRSR